MPGTPSRSQGWLCQFPEISLMPIQAHCSACVYIWGLHTAARTHLISFCHSQHQLRVRVQSESNREPRLAAVRLKKRPAPAGSLFLMVSLDKLGILDTAWLYSLQILTLKSIITLHSKFGRALPDTEAGSSTAVGKKGSKGKLLPAAAVLSAGPAHHQKPAVCKEPKSIPKSTKSPLNVFLFLYIMRHIAQFVSVKLYLSRSPLFLQHGKKYCNHVENFTFALIWRAWKTTLEM